MTGRAGLVACLAVAAVLRFVVLGRADLWSDEVHTLHAVALPWGEMCAERFRAGHVPLWFLIEKAWVAVAGDSQFAIRASSAAFGTLSLLPAWTFFRRMLAPSHATAAVALVAVHPLLVELSREARMYSFALLLLFVMLDGVASALASDRVPRRVWIASALGCATHPSFAFAVVSVVVWLAWERRARREPSPVLARAQLAAASGMVVLLAALPFVEPQHQELTRRAWHAEAAMFVGRTFVGSDFVHVTYGKVVAGALLAAWLLRLAAAHRHRDGSPARRLGWTLALAVPATSFAVGALGAVPWGPARYVHAASLGWILLATAYTVRDRSESGVPDEAPRRYPPETAVREVLLTARVGASLLTATTGARGLTTLVVVCAATAGYAMSRPRGWSVVALALRHQRQERFVTIDRPDGGVEVVDAGQRNPGFGPADGSVRVFAQGDAVVLSHYLGESVRVATDAEAVPVPERRRLTYYGGPVAPGCWWTSVELDVPAPAPVAPR